MESTENTGPPAKSSKTSHRLGGRRTHRACDRCRVKKSKCNGMQPCATCKSNERTCVFSALRRRDIRKWHCHMQDTVDEAIQRLYRACKESSCFPGVLPDERDGYVTTESILQGMGFNNLDLGPRAGGALPQNTLYVPPIRTQFGYENYHQSGQHYANKAVLNLKTESSVSPQSIEQASSMNSAFSAQSPHRREAEHSTSSGLRGTYRHESPLTSLSMTEQFHQAVEGFVPMEYHHHHQNQYNSVHHPMVRDRGPQQLHQNNNHPGPSVAPSSIVLGSAPQERSDSQTSSSSGEAYSHQPYYMHDDRPLLIYQQLWPHPNEMTMVP